MELQENIEEIKVKLSSFGFEDWKIASILQITNSYEEALNYLQDIDWDSIDFNSTKHCEPRETETSGDKSNAAASSSDTIIIKTSGILENNSKDQQIEDNIHHCQAAKREGMNQKKLEGIRTLEEEIHNAGVEERLIKDQIYANALDMGFDDKQARWASETFNEVEKAADYLIALSSAENKYIEENKIDLNYQKEEEKNCIKIAGSAGHKRAINEDGKDFDIIFEICREVGLDEEKSKKISRVCKNIEEAEEMIYQFFNENMPTEKINLKHSNQQELREVNEKYTQTPENEEDKELFDLNYEENKSEEELNEIGWHGESQQNIGERWISSESISINGNIVEGTNREQIMDILSEIIPAKGLSEEAKAKLIEFLYEGEILFKKCVICYELFQEKNVLVKLPCGHVFHKDCLLKYAERNDNCPLDRKKI